MPRNSLILTAVIAGAASALGFAPWNLWPLTLIAIGGLVALIEAAPGPRSAFARGWLFGTAHFSVSLGWIAHAFTYQDKMPPALGWVAVVGLSMFLALYIGLAAGLARGVPGPGVARVLALAAAWMLAEWLRGWVLTGFAWNPLGAAWLEVAGVRQLARFGGAISLSALAVLAGGGLWLLVRRRWRGGGALLATVALAGLLGLVWKAPPAASNGPIVHLVQPNISQDEKYAPGKEADNVRRYLDLTAIALARRTSPKGAIIVWSEGAVPYLVEEDAQVRAALAAVLGPDDLLLFGGTAAFRDASGALVALGNSLFALDSRGQLIARHDKSHLVPLGEYVPARPLMTAFGLARLVPGDLEFRPGPGPRSFALPGFPAVGMQVCYEIIFPGAVVDRSDRPAWIVNVSNDSWYGESMPAQHVAQARLRAIEEGLPIARATPTGISAMIDGHGNVIGALPMGAADVSSVVLPPALQVTPFGRWGHWLTLMMALGLLALAWVMRRSNI